MGNFLYLLNATLKHSNGNSYPATNDIIEQTFKTLPIAFVVKDDEFAGFERIFQIGNSLIVDTDGNYTNKYYQIKNVIPDFFNMPLFGLWSGDDDGKLYKLQSVFPNYNAITTYASGAYNNAIILKDDYELYLTVANMSTVTGTYKNGSLLSTFNRYGSIVGYASRSIIWIYNESLTLSFGVNIEPTYSGSAVGLQYANAETATPDVIKKMLLDIAIQGDIPTDPYFPGGESGTGGGTGSFDGTGDDIDIPSLPTLTAVSTGFITLFNPSIAQLQSLSNYMWSDAFDLNTFKKLFANPMDCVLGLSIVPVSVPNGETGVISIGNISTGISMTKAASQYVEIDCGTLNVNEFWGAYLDYDPFTKAEIYLPYIGTHPIATDDIMNKSVHVVYHVDILSGACAAYVKCGNSVLYTFIGQCSSSIPITGNDWTNVINGVLSIAGAVGSMVATGGASSPIAAGEIASAAVNSFKPSVEKSGSLSGTGGMLSVQTPYLILTRPRQALPANQNKFSGYPSFITKKLGDCEGYTEIDSIHLEGIPATEQELSEIESLLKGGVIL